jgi:phage-related holin
MKGRHSKKRKIITLVLIIVAVLIAAIVITHMGSEDGFTFLDVLRNVQRAMDIIEPLYDQAESIID